MTGSATARPDGPPSSSRRDDEGGLTAGSKRSVRWLKALNFSIADVQNGMGPYVALFLQSSAHWNPAQIGTALAFGNIAQVIAQTPAGALIDRVRQKRALIAIGIVMIAVACLVTPLLTSLAIVTTGQVLIGVAGAIFPATLAAMALGLVGRRRMDAQMGTNQAFNAAGNVFAAIAIGAVGYLVGLQWMFFLVIGLCVVSLLCLWRIRPEDIDYDLARGADGADRVRTRDPAYEDLAASIRDVFATFRQLAKQRAVVVFLVCAVMFHFANAAMVPLVTQMLGADQGAQRAVLYTSGYMLASQIVFVVVAAMSGRLAARIGRKPLFLFAFAMLALRGVLYTSSSAPAALIAVQCMDGFGAGVFGVVAVLIIADLTKGTGRFNAAQGAVATAQGLGAFLSNALAAFLAARVGMTPTFLTLAAIAAAGFVVFAVFMPETRDRAHPIPNASIGATMTSHSLVAWLHVGDLHASNEDGWESLDLLGRIVDEMRHHVPRDALDFAFLPGDNANHGEAEQYRRIAATLARMPMPVHAIPGDHDFEPGSLDPFAAIATRPLPAMVRYDGRRALFLDIVSAGSGGPDFRLGDAQTAWLRAQLSDARRLAEPRPLVFMHAFPSDLRAGGSAIGRLFADAHVAFVDTGHTHYNELINDGAVIYSATRSTGQIEEGPPGFAIAAVDGDVASWRFKALDAPWPFVLVTTPADVRMAVDAPSSATSQASTVRALVLGSDIATVTLSIDGAAPLTMRPVAARPGLWTIECDRPLAAAEVLTVVATDAQGAVGQDDVRLRGAIDPEDWVARGLLGTRLGPNANGRHW